MRQRLLCGLVLAGLALASLAVLAQEHSPMWVGMWKRNLAKSKYSGTPPTGEQIVKIELVNGLMQITTTTTTPQGQTTPGRPYQVRFDGSERTVNVETGAAMTYKFIDTRIYEGFTRVKGQPTTTTRYALSVDGKTHTLTTTGKNAQGQVVNNVVVYDRQ
jgi:hypothetical protein